MIISIREFQQNLYKYIRQGKNLVVTIKGKKAFVVTFEGKILEEIDKNVVTTSPNTSGTIGISDVVTKPKIAELRDMIRDIEEKAPIVETNVWCDACRKIKQFVPAIGRFDVVSGDSMATVNLCKKHEGLAI